jgi:hypothetical protein
MTYITELYQESSGVLNGGVLSVGSPDTAYSVSDGNGQLVNSIGQIKKVDWANLTDIVITDPAPLRPNGTPVSNKNTRSLTYVWINEAGSVLVSSTDGIADDLRDYIFLGVLVHTNFTTNVINAVDNKQMFIRNIGNQLRDLSHVIGIINERGNVIIKGGGSFQLVKSEGEIYSFGSNYNINPLNPNIVTLSEVDTATTGTFQYRMKDGSSSDLTLTDFVPTILDNGTSYPGTTLSSNQWGVSRVFTFISNALKIQPPQYEYGTSDEAISKINSEEYITEPSFSNGLLIGYIVAKENAADLTSAIFIKAAKFGGNGGGASTGLDISTKVNIDGTSVITGGLILQETTAISPLQTITITAPTDVTNTHELVLPPDLGSSGSVLTDTGSGVLGWISPSSLNVSGALEGEIQLRNAAGDDLDSTTNFTINTTDNTMTTRGDIVNLLPEVEVLSTFGTLSTLSKKCKIFGDYLYVIGGNTSSGFLKIYNITTSSTPTIADEIVTGINNPYDFVVYNNTLYLVRNTTSVGLEISIIDITQKDNISVTSTVNFGVGGTNNIISSLNTGVELYKNYIFIGNSTDLHLIKINNPLSLVYIGTQAIPSKFIETKQNELFCVYSSLSKYDITNIENIGSYTQKANIVLAGNAISFAMDGKHAGLIVSDAIFIFNITSESSFSQIASQSGGAIANNTSVVFVGDILYALSTGQVMYAIQINKYGTGNIGASVMDVSGDYSQDFMDMAIKGKYGFMILASSVANTSIVVIDLKNPKFNSANIEELSSSNINIAGNLDVSNKSILNDVYTKGDIISAGSVHGLSITDGVADLTLGALSGITTLQLKDTTTGTINITAPSDITEAGDTYSLTLPAALGTSGSVLTDTVGDGVLTWSIPSVISGGTVVGAIQYNNGSSGLAADDTNFVYTLGTKTLKISDDDTGVITGLKNPTTNFQAVNKAYVDSIAGSGVSWKNSVVVMSASLQALTALIDSNNGGLIIDGHTFVNGDRILLGGQGGNLTTPHIENGIYRYVDAAGGASGSSFTRTEDTPIGGSASGAAVFVEKGVYDNQGWIVTTDDSNFGDAIEWSQFNAQTSVSGITNSVQFTADTSTLSGSSNFTWDGTSLQLGDDKAFVSGAGDELTVVHSGVAGSITNTVGSLTVENSASSDVVLKLGEAAGGTKVSFQNNIGSEVASVNSNGLFTSTGLQFPDNSSTVNIGTTKTSGHLQIGSSSKTTGNLSMLTGTGGSEIHLVAPGDGSKFFFRLSSVSIDISAGNSGDINIGDSNTPFFTTTGHISLGAKQTTGDINLGNVAQTGKFNVNTEMIVVGSIQSNTGLKLLETTGATNTISLVAPANVTNTHTLVLPSDLGSEGAVLTDTGGNGILNWTVPVVIAAGADTQIQFNSGGTTFAGSADFTWNDTTKDFTVLGDTTTNNLILREPGDTNLITLAAPTGITTDYTITLPVDGGENKNVLITNGSGTTSWVSSNSNYSITSVNATTYTVLPTDDIIGVPHTSTADVTITLPLITSVGFKKYTVIDFGGNSSVFNITIAANAADTILGDADIVLRIDYNTFTLVNDGSNTWFIM